MIGRTRTARLVALFIVAAALLGAGHGRAREQKPPVPGEPAGARAPADWVDPWIDSANSRWFFFNSACRPFGMVNLSPDTHVKGAWDSGYRYHDEHIRGFSHVHAWQLSGIPIMPATGEFKGHKGSDAYKSRFSHDNEIVRPGYHKVFLEDYGVTAELTSTDRVGFHRYTFPKSDSARFILDLGSELGPSKMTDALARKVSDSEIEGYSVNGGTIRRPKDTPVYFVARFNKPFISMGGWKWISVKEDIGEIGGKRSGAFVNYKTEEGEQILVKVAISYVSAEQARKNLEAELPGWDFGGTVAESGDVWNKWLSRIEVKGGTDARRTRFYTDLWRSLLGRRKVSDVDGKYMDMTGDEPRVRQIPLDDKGEPAYNHYNSDAFWGARWGIGPLWSLAYPGVTSEFVNCLVDYYKNGGMIPRGPSGGNYTFVMTSATSTPFIASAYLKGIRDYDVEAAYAGMRKNHFPGGLMSRAGYEHNSERGGGVEHYIGRGYVPEGILAKAFHVSGATQTLEYAYQDWCLAQVAGAMGKDGDRRLFMERAGNYKNVFDPETKLMRPRTKSGGWLKPFDPTSRKGFVEGNALQYTWFVPHDVAGLIELMGGREEFNRRLGDAFEQAEAYDFVAEHGRYDAALNYANQPCMQPAHMFNYSGAPWLSQKWARAVKDKAFGGTTPDLGYRDDEDQGLLGSLGVLLAIGLFDVQGGCNSEPVWQITSPVFGEVTVHLDPEYYPGGEFTIKAANNSPENIYIQSAELNGAPLNKPWFTHKELVAGGELALELGPAPNKEWGASPEAAPPSMSGPAGKP